MTRSRMFQLGELCGLCGAWSGAWTGVVRAWSGAGMEWCGYGVERGLECV